MCRHKAPVHGMAPHGSLPRNPCTTSHPHDPLRHQKSPGSSESPRNSECVAAWLCECVGCVAAWLWGCLVALHDSSTRTDDPNHPSF